MLAYEAWVESEWNKRNNQIWDRHRETGVWEDNEYDEEYYGEVPDEYELDEGYDEDEEDDDD
jgi:hypothetical protein